jgi:hypothetical protein
MRSPWLIREQGRAARPSRAIACYQNLTKYLVMNNIDAWLAETVRCAVGSFDHLVGERQRRRRHSALRRRISLISCSGLSAR